MWLGIYGWKFEVGDKIVFRYYDGSKMAEQEVTVLGILNGQYTLDFNEAGAWFLMPEQSVLGMVSYQSLNSSLQVSTKSLQNWLQDGRSLPWKPLRSAGLPISRM